MTDYSLFYVEQYGHGKLENNELAENQKVVIADNDGHYDVYECDSDDEAQALANWYLGAVYESYPDEVELIKNDSRYFSIENI